MGHNPLFSYQRLRSTIVKIILVALIFAPVLQTSPRFAQGSGPTYSASIVNYAFQPSHINITTGTTVVWTNNGADFHTVTSDPGTNKTQGGTPLLNSGTLSTGKSFNYTFYLPGYYPYQCSLHTYMNGAVSVTGSPITPPQNPPSQNSPTNYIVIFAGGLVAVLGTAAAVVLFARKKRRTSVARAYS